METDSAYYIISDGNPGLVVSYSSQPKHEIEDPFELEVTTSQFEDIVKNAYYREGDEIFVLPQKPSIDWVFDPITKGWIDPRSTEEKQNTVHDYIVFTRQPLLVESDWTQLVDSSIESEVQAEWAVYRQELRDLPAKYSTAELETDVIWPVPPGTASR